MKARRFSLIVCVAVMVTSGAYVFINLYRWEWNRAIISGVFFIASEIALGAWIILGRLARIEERLEKREAKTTGVTRLPDDVLTPRDHFAWLKDSADDLSVFVPVLMGAGILLSAIAWGVEKIALMTARPFVERSLQAQASPLSLPTGGFFAPPARAIPTPSKGSIRSLGTVLALGLALAITIYWLANLTQTRRDAVIRTADGAAIDLVIHTKNPASPSMEAARRLWATCLGTVGHHSLDANFSQLGASQVRIRTQPALGDYAQRRLRGCLVDSTLDNIQAKIIAVTNITTEDASAP